MDRIMIIGCCGAGKSTLSKKLADITNLPLIHLDQYYWKPNWVETERLEWNKIVRHLAAQNQWIIDGNYGGTMDIRLARADTIIYLDVPSFRCLGRITKRIIKYHGRSRPDMPDGCDERFDLNFFYYVATYNMTRRRSLLDKLEVLKLKKNIFILNNDRQVESFLDDLKARHGWDNLKDK